jgi:hypothetical protein
MAARYARHDLEIAKLSALLRAQDLAGLEQCLLHVGLQFACSIDFVQRARMRHLDDLVLLLATLGVDNGVQRAHNQRLLDLYQSSARGMPQGWLASLGRDHAVRTAADRCAARARINPDIASANGSGKSLPPAAWRGVDGDAELALEFLLDHSLYADAHDLLKRRLGAGSVTHHGLNLCEVYLTRADAWKPTSAERVWLAQSYRLLHTKLSKVPACHAAAERVALHLLREAIGAGDHASVLNWSAPFANPGNRATCHYLKVEAACRLSDIPRACREMDQVLGGIADEPLEWIRSSFRAPGGNGEGKRAFDLDSARTVLADLQDVLEGVGQKPFLVSGTLLGYARVRNFLGHDKDIDVGILAGEDPYASLEALARSGKFRLDTRGLTMQRNYNLAVTHVECGMAVDIFIYHLEGDRLVTGVRNNIGYLQRFAFTPFEVQPIEFIGLRTWAPSDIDLNLRENFGDWQTPDPGYISHLESPSTCDWGGDVHQLVARLKLLEAIIKDAPTMGARVVDRLQRLQGHPHALDSRLLGRVARGRGFIVASRTNMDQAVSVEA